MPNTFAYLMLLTWPIFAMLIARKKSADSATILLFIVPYLLLPYQTLIDLPGMPELDKNSIAAITALLILSIKNKNFSYLPNSRIIQILIILLFLGPIFTITHNMDTLYYGPTTVHSLSFHDLPEMLLNRFTGYYIPFMLAYNYLDTKEAHRKLLLFIVVAGLIYSLPALWEVRMSPQLHKIVYGFFPSSWIQQIREGGFRPVVFLGHGLYVAVFFSQVFVAAAVFWKGKIEPLNKSGLLLIAFFAVVLILSKSWSAFIYSTLASIVIIFSGNRRWLQVAVAISLLVAVFPLLRTANLIPTEAVYELVAEYSAERAESLQYRFNNEDQLLEKANERMWYGWGGWGRPRVYATKTGEDISVTDGIWIINYGYGGILGYAATFGLMVLPILLVFSARNKNTKDDFDASTIGMCMMLSLNLLDLIPNSSLTPLTLIVAGSLAGFVGKVIKQKNSEQIINNQNQPAAERNRYYQQWEISRHCQGDSKSLTFIGVHRGNSKS
jgi:hypothetical protein